MEKSNTSLRKELAEAKSLVIEAEGRAADADKKASVAESTLKLEREVSKLEVGSYKQAMESLEKEKAELTEQLEGVAF